MSEGKRFCRAWTVLVRSQVTACRIPVREIRFPMASKKIAHGVGELLPLAGEGFALSFEHAAAFLGELEHESVELLCLGACLFYADAESCKHLELPAHGFAEHFGG